MQHFFKNYSLLKDCKITNHKKFGIKWQNTSSPFLYSKKRTKNELEGFLTQTELEETLFNDMKPNSAPGIDSFTVKFLRTFWPTLAPLITTAINEMKKRETNNNVKNSNNETASKRK